MRIVFLLISILLHVGVFAQSEKYYDEFQKLASKDMKLVFEDSFRKDWQQIAYETGFSTPNNFNRVFKQVTGTSPGLYEKGVIDNKKSAIEQ